MHNKRREPKEAMLSKNQRCRALSISRERDRPDRTPYDHKPHLENLAGMLMVVSKSITP